MKAVNFSNFHLNVIYWIDKVTNGAGGIIIKYNRGKNLVLIPRNKYNSLKETLYLLSGKNGEVLLKSIKELES